jgi:hypothetical protein
MDLAREGSPGRGNALATEILQELNEADVRGRSASDVHLQAQAKATAGFVHENFRGDIAAALASYRAAVQLKPSDKAAQEALDRLQRADAMLRARINPKR